MLHQTATFSHLRYNDIYWSNNYRHNCVINEYQIQSSMLHWGLFSPVPETEDSQPTELRNISYLMPIEKDHNLSRCT